MWYCGEILNREKNYGRNKETCTYLNIFLVHFIFQFFITQEYKNDHPTINSLPKTRMTSVFWSILPHFDHAIAMRPSMINNMYDASYLIHTYLVDYQHFFLFRERIWLTFQVLSNEEYVRHSYRGVATIDEQVLLTFYHMCRINQRSIVD